MIVDAHCHAGLGDRLTSPASTAAPLGAYLRRARAAGIARTIVLPAFHTDYAVANAALARLVARSGSRLIGFAMVHPVRDAGEIGRMVRRAVGEWGFRGIKVHGHDAFPTREVCQVARELRVPVLVDVYGRPEMVDLFAPAYPDVPFIIPHLGSFADDWRVYQRVVDQLVRHPNVYADTSGVRQFDYLLQAVHRAGPGKLIFGSDGPWLHPGVELHKIRLLGLDPAGERAVLGENILRLLANRTPSPRTAEPCDPGLIMA